MNFFAVALLVLLTSTSAVFAAENTDLGKEIIYRTSLGRADDVRLLLKQGADANTKNEKNVPLIALAAARKDGEEIAIIDALLSAGVDINSKDASGQTALFYAAREGNTDLVQHLLNKGIDYYAPDKDGTIARTVAHQAGHAPIVQLMDQFVVDQSKKVAEAYKKYHEAIRERDAPTPEPVKPEPAAVDDKKTDDSLSDATKDLEKKTSSEKPVALPTIDYTPSASDLAEIEAKKRQAEMEEAAAKQKALAAKRESDDFKNDMYALVFHSCSFQYLSFCFQTGQRTDVTFEQLSEGVEVQREDVIRMLKTIPEEYGLDYADADRLSNNAKKNIQSVMDRMPSKAYMFENEVCMMNDVRVRCRALANSWRDLQHAGDEDESLDQPQKNTRKTQAKKPAPNKPRKTSGYPFKH